MIKEMNSSSTQLNDFEDELNEIKSKLREVGDDKKRSKHEERIFEAIETMKRIFTGVHG